MYVACVYKYVAFLLTQVFYKITAKIRRHLLNTAS